MKGVSVFLTFPGSVAIRLFCAAAGMAACLVISGCETPEAPAPKAVVRPVKVITVAGDRGSQTVTLPGRTRANRRVDLAFKVPGPLVELPVEEGQAVKKGALIARILPRDFKVRMDQARAQALNANRQFDRYKELYVRRQVSKADYDRFKAARAVAAAQLQDAGNALKDTYLRAPFDGIVAKRYVENFEEVQAKQPIVFFQDNSMIEVLVDAPETLIATLKQGDEPVDAYATFAAAPHRQFPLTLKEYSTEADPQTQTYQVVLVMDQPGDINILPGMTATVTGRDLRGEADAPQIVIPAISVMEDAQGRAFVWTLDKTAMTVRKKEVTRGEMTGSDSIFIREGLAGGDIVVIAGVTQLRQGMTVAIWNK